jgi:hypothetical protein
MALEALAVDNGRTGLVLFFLGVRCPPGNREGWQIHILWNVEREAKMDPPIQTEYLRSGGATIFTLIEAGAKAVISLDMRSEMPKK